MGRAVALAYAQVGARLVLVVAARSQDQIEETKAEVRRLGTAVLALPCDVSDRGQVQHFVGEALRVFGRIDILGNNAEVSVEEWDHTIAVNLHGPFLCAQAVIPSVRQQGGGSIINVSSPSGQGQPLCGVCMQCPNGGSRAVPGPLAAELAPFRIRVNAIRPGLIATGRVPVVCG